MPNKQTPLRRLRRTFVVMLVALAGAVLTNFLLARLVRRNLHQVKQSNTMMRLLKRSNDLRLKTAGSQRSATAILTHVGRRSGRSYLTPLGAWRYGDGFILPLAYGSGTDWCRNVMAAGTCALAWKGRTFDLDRPEIVSGPDVMHAWPVWMRIMLRGAGIHDFLWVHESPAGPQNAHQTERVSKYPTT